MSTSQLPDQFHTFLFTLKHLPTKYNKDKNSGIVKSSSGSPIQKTIWAKSWEKGSSNFLLNQSVSVHAYARPRLVLWLRFPLGLSFMWADSIGSCKNAQIYFSTRITNWNSCKNNHIIMTYGNLDFPPHQVLQGKPELKFILSMISHTKSEKIRWFLFELSV